MGGGLEVRRCFVGSRRPRLAITNAGARAKLEAPSYSQSDRTREPYRPSWPRSCSSAVTTGNAGRLRGPIDAGTADVQKAACFERGR